jgi:hypothetical protein
MNPSAPTQIENRKPKSFAVFKGFRGFSGVFRGFEELVFHGPPPTKTE